jgi:hypothetical protein
MSAEHPVIPTRRSAGSLLRQMLLQELTIGEGPIGQMDMLSLIANAADWLDEAVAENATTVLTNVEREAIRDAADRYATITPESAATAAILRGLLDRTGSE